MDKIHSATGAPLRALLLLLCMTACSWAATADPEWTFETFIRVPYANTLFMARDAQDNVYATTFNSSRQPAEVVAFKVSDALGASPKVTVFDRFLAPPIRGYAGIAVDEQNNIYLSADQGDGAPSFIKKYTPSLELDQTFGANGILASTRVRLLGLAATRNYLICAVGWARFLVIDSKGNFLGMTPQLPPEQQALIRDIDFIPGTQEVVGVDRDSVYVFTGGSLNNLQGYQLRALARGNSQPQAGAAIYYCPVTDKIYYSIKNGHRLGTITRAGHGVNEVEASGAPQGTSQPADTVISRDGSTMFVSDLGSPNIVRYRRGGVQVAVAQPKAAGRVIAALETASAPEARATAKPVTDMPETGKSGVLEAKASTAVSENSLASAPPPAIPAAVTPGVMPGPQGTDSLPTPNIPSVASAADGKWIDSIDRAFQIAVTSRKKVIVFFTTPESTVAQDIEKNVFGDEAFFGRYPDVVWARVDVSKAPETMGTYGFYRVPLLIIFSSNKTELKRLQGTFTGEDLAKAYSSVK